MFRLCSDIVRKELLLTNHFAEGRSYQMMTKASLQITSSALYCSEQVQILYIRSEQVLKGSQRYIYLEIYRSPNNFCYR